MRLRITFTGYFSCYVSRYVWAFFYSLHLKRFHFYSAMFMAKRSGMYTREKLLKDRFLRAVVLGELGELEEVEPGFFGLVITLKAFKLCFSDITSQYVSSFMPAATFEPGQFRPTKTRFLFRLRKGAYLVHSDVLVAYMRLMLAQGELGAKSLYTIRSQTSRGGNSGNDDSSVCERKVSYRVYAVA